MQTPDQEKSVDDLLEAVKELTKTLADLVKEQKELGAIIKTRVKAGKF